MANSDYSPTGDALDSRLAGALKMFDDGLRLLNSGRSAGLSLLDAALSTDPKLYDRLPKETLVNTGIARTVNGEELGPQILHFVNKHDGTVAAEVYQLGIRLASEGVRAPAAGILETAYHLDRTNAGAILRAYNLYEELGDESEDAARALIAVPLGRQDDRNFRPTDLTLDDMARIPRSVLAQYSELMLEAKKFHDKAVLIAPDVDHINKDLRTNGA